MHIDISIHRALDLDRLSSVPLLSVELTPVHWLDLHHVVTLGVPSALPRVGRGDNCLTLWIEAEVSLIHKLLIETRIDRCVVVRDRLILGWGGSWVDLRCSILEQLVEDALFLLIMNIHTFALYGAATRSKTKNGYQYLCKRGEGRYEGVTVSQIWYENQLTRISAFSTGFHCSLWVSDEPSHFKNS